MLLLRLLTSTVARAVTLERILTYQTYVVKHDEKRREYDANYLRRIISNRTIGIVAAENVQRKWQIPLTLLWLKM